MPTTALASAPASAYGDLAATDHTCAISSTGALSCWGPNDYGQCGQPPSMNNPVYVPMNIAGPSTGVRWSQVGTGNQFTCALDTTGAVWCWGRDGAGELGDGNTGGMDFSHAMPEQVPLPAAATSLYVGELHTCAIVGADAYCWGYNGGGALGGGFSSESAPVQVQTAGVSGAQWTSLALGEYHTCGLRDDNSLWCWGDNRRGQLGNDDSTRTDSAVPVAVPGQWQAVTAAQSHTCALDTSGGLYCWGNNDDGELLDGKGWRSELVAVPTPSQ
jgi:alpha-tubulin suppressor-like RCC1 family protein